MIAQGEFRRLLTSSTKERSAIFRKLFGTEYLARFQDDLAQRRRELQNDYDALKRTTDTLADQAEFGDATPRALERQSRRAEETLSTDRLRAMLDAQINEDAAALTAREERIAEAREARDEASRRVALAQEAANAQELMRQAELRKAEGEKRLERARKDLAAAREKDPERDRLAKAIAAQEAALEGYERLKSADLSLAEAQRGKNDAQNAADKAAEEYREAGRPQQGRAQRTRRLRGRRGGGARPARRRPCRRPRSRAKKRIGASAGGVRRLRQGETPKRQARAPTHGGRIRSPCWRPEKRSLDEAEAQRLIAPAPDQQVLEDAPAQLASARAAKDRADAELRGIRDSLQNAHHALAAAVKRARDRRGRGAARLPPKRRGARESGGGAPRGPAPPSRRPGGRYRPGARTRRALPRLRIPRPSPPGAAAGGHPHQISGRGARTHRRCGPERDPQGGGGRLRRPRARRETAKRP